MHPYVVIRSHNDMPLIADTLAMLYRQQQPFELIAFDNESTDGSVAELRKYTDRVISVPAGTYVPGRVLNQAMERARSERVVFINSDCTPQNERWLENLLAGFSNGRVAAVFGRQIPRPDCHPLYTKDTEETYGDGARQKKWRHCFSMASSAIRRSVWEELKFNETLQYSEDIDWSWRARQRGYTIRYVADAVVMHSHNYTPGQSYKRQYGEGQAEAVIFDWSPWQRSLLRYVLLPYMRRVASDWQYCLPRLALGATLYSPLLRLVQLLGRRRGFRAGWREEKREAEPNHRRAPRGEWEREIHPSE